MKIILTETGNIRYTYYKLPVYYYTLQYYTGYYFWSFSLTLRCCSMLHWNILYLIKTRTSDLNRLNLASRKKSWFLKILFKIFSNQAMCVTSAQILSLQEKTCVKGQRKAVGTQFGSQYLQRRCLWVLMTSLFYILLFLMLLICILFLL